MFDCVMPTRNARNGQLFVRAGRVNIANAQHRDDPRPVEEGCPCECCASYSRAYLSHLFHAKELLYYRLATVHNLQHYLDLARRARAAIIAGVVERIVVVDPEPWPSAWGSSWPVAGTAMAPTSPRR